LSQDVRVIHRNLGAKGRIGEDEVEGVQISFQADAYGVGPLGARALLELAPQLNCGSPPKHQRVLQRVEGQNVAVPVVVQDHVHASRAFQIGVEVNPVEAGFGELAHEHRVLSISLDPMHPQQWVFRWIQLIGQLAPHVIKRVGEETAAPTGRVQNSRPMGRLG